MLNNVTTYTLLKGTATAVALVNCAAHIGGG